MKIMAESDSEDSRKRKLSSVQPAFKKVKFNQPDAFVTVIQTQSKSEAKTPLKVEVVSLDEARKMAGLTTIKSSQSEQHRMTIDVPKISILGTKDGTKESLETSMQGRIAKHQADVSVNPIHAQTPQRNTLDKGLCDDLFMLKEWFSIEVKDEPVEYLTQKECNFIKDALETRLLGNVSLALRACKDLAKTHLMSLLQSYADGLDDICDTWAKKLNDNLLDVPRSLAEYLLSKETETYQDLMDLAQDMPSVMVSMCLGAMLQNVENLTKHCVKDVMLRLTIIGYLLFCSPSEYGRSEQEEEEEEEGDVRQELDQTNETSDESDILDDEYESDMKDDHQDKATITTDEFHAKDSIEEIKSEKSDTGFDNTQNTEEEEISDSTRAEPSDKKSVEDPKEEVGEKLLEEFCENYSIDYRREMPLEGLFDLPRNTQNTEEVEINDSTPAEPSDQKSVETPEDEFREKLLEEFRENYYIDYRREIPLEGVFGLPRNDLSTVQIDHDYTRRKLESDHEVEVFCPFCMWKFRSTDSVVASDTQVDIDGKTDPIIKEVVNKLTATGTKIKTENELDTSTPIHKDTVTKETTNKYVPSNPKASMRSTLISNQNAAKDSKTASNDIDRAQKEFNNHIKSRHCNTTGKAYKETVYIFSRTGLWMDNMVAPELGQVFICPHCLNVETVRSDHYVHVMRHENQNHQLTCFPCRQEFASYEQLTRHYSEKHGASEIEVPADLEPTKIDKGNAPIIKASSDTPAEAEFSFDYLDLCLEMEERNPGIDLFVKNGYPVFMAISHAYKTFPSIVKNTAAKGQFHSCMFNCNAVFKTAEELYMHRVKEHAEDCIAVYVTKHTKEPSQWAKYRLEPLIETCEVCDKSVLGLAKFAFHHAEHPQANPTRCEQCRQSFPSKKVMYLHECCRTCERCGKLYTTKRGVKRHQCKALKLGINMFPCGQCRAKFNTRMEYDAHQKSAHGVNNRMSMRVCSKCGKEFVGLAADHLYNIHVAQTNCESLPSEIVKRSETMGINRTNDPAFENPERLQCNTCQEVFSSIHHLEEHLAKRLCTQTLPVDFEAEQSFSSNFEEAQYIRQMRRNEKKKRHEQKTRYPCERCGKLVFDLKKHQKYVNCNGTVKVKARRQVERKPCERCGVMLEKHFLKRHVGLVNCTKDPNFVQDQECLQKYSRYVCKRCNKVFTKAKLVKYHMARVNCTNDPNFVKDLSASSTGLLAPCPRCGKMLRERMITWHLKSVNCNNDPDFIPEKKQLKQASCKKCGWNFSSEYKLREHLASVNCNNDPDFVKPPRKENVKKFPCDKCGKLFTSLTYVKQHQRSVNCDKDPSFIAQPHRPGKSPSLTKTTVPGTAEKVKEEAEAVFVVEEINIQNAGYLDASQSAGQDFRIFVTEDPLNYASVDTIQLPTQYTDEKTFLIDNLQYEQDVEININD